MIGCICLDCSRRRMEAADDMSDHWAVTVLGNLFMTAVMTFACQSDTTKLKSRYNPNFRFPYDSIFIFYFQFLLSDSIYVSSLLTFFDQFPASKEKIIKALDESGKLCQDAECSFYLGTICELHLGCYMFCCNINT